MSTVYFNDFAEKIKALEDRVAKLEGEAGENLYRYCPGKLQYVWQSYDSRPVTRISAMNAVHLILRHLGLKLNHVEQVPARTELAPLDTIKVGKYNRDGRKQK